MSSGVVVKKLVMCFDRAILLSKLKISCVIKEETELYNIVYPVEKMLEKWCHLQFYLS